MKKIIILLGAIASLHFNICDAETVHSTPAQAFASLQEAVKNKNYEEIADLMFPPQMPTDRNTITREEYAASLRKRTKDNPERFEFEMTFGGMLYSGKIRNIDIIDIKEKTEDEPQIARIFVEGITSTPTSEGIKEIHSLGLFQAFEYQNQWYFIFGGGEEMYFGITPKPEFSTPQFAYRTIRNAQRMLDWCTLYDGLPAVMKKNLSKEQYRNFILTEKQPSYQDLISLNTVENGNGPSTKEIVEEVAPVCNLSQVKVKRSSRGIEYYQDGYSEWESENFVKEGENWKWMPSQKSDWIPKEAYSAILTEQDLKKQKNEVEARRTLRKISTACEVFRAVRELRGTPDYPPNLDVLTKSDPPYVYGFTGEGEKDGYKFIYTRISADKFTCTAIPLEKGVTGDNTFFIDESDYVKLNDSHGEPIW